MRGSSVNGCEREICDGRRTKGEGMDENGSKERRGEWKNVLRKEK